MGTEFVGGGIHAVATDPPFGGGDIIGKSWKKSWIIVPGNTKLWF
jgi:hypothetical protein